MTPLSIAQKLSETRYYGMTKDQRLNLIATLAEELSYHLRHLGIELPQVIKAAQKNALPGNHGSLEYALTTAIQAVSTETNNCNH